MIGEFEEGVEEGFVARQGAPRSITAPMRELKAPIGKVSRLPAERLWALGCNVASSVLKNIGPTFRYVSTSKG